MNKNLLAAVSGKSSTINSTAAAAPLSVLLIWLLGLAGVDMPPEVAASVVAIIMSILGVGMRFLTTMALKDKIDVE